MASISPREARLRDGSALALRAAQESDAPAMGALLRAAAAEKAHTIAEPDEVISDDALASRIRSCAADAGSLMLVAALPDGVVGGLSAWVGGRRRQSHRLKFGLLVAQEWRGLGVGRAMIERLLEWAREHPTIEKVSLSVFAENHRAIALYRSLGFGEEGRRIAEFKIGPGTYADDILMAMFVKAPPGAAPRAQ